MEKKKPVVYLDEVLSENNVFVLSTTVNYDDKTIVYGRGIKKAEVIDGHEFVGADPEVPYMINEIDKKTKKRRVYVAKFAFEEDLDDAMFGMIGELYDEIKTEGHFEGVSLSIA